MTFEDETLRYNTLKLAIQAYPNLDAKSLTEIATIFEDYILGRTPLQ